MRSIFLFVYLHSLTCVRCCEYSELVGNILGCAHDEKEVNIESVHNGSVCIVENQQGVQHFKCEGTNWIIQQEAIDSPIRNIRRKRGWGRSLRNFFKGAVKVVGCVFSLFTRCAFTDRRPSDRTPPSIICSPPKMFVTAKPFLYVARASWDEPIASDETDGSITPRRRSGYPPGHNFPEGETKVTYEAKDRSGNRASCNIIIHVNVVRCDPPKRIQNGYFQCYPVTDHLNGGKCTFGCYEGFDLHGGPEHVYCMNNSRWSDSQPICKPWKCPALPRLDGAGEPSCTDDFNFRSVCSYNCGSGFDMPPKVSKALVCDKTKSWQTFGTPKCVDVEPPTFKPNTCPSIVIAGTDTGMNSTIVSWTLPEVMDNSNTAIRHNKTIYSPGDRLTTGIYSVQYGAMDEAGNVALNDCSFKVIVQEIRCSKLYPTPHLKIDCPQGYRTGAWCNISCDLGKVLVGSDYVGCNRNGTGLYGTWNWKGNMQSVCINGKACVALIPPKNGAVVCDNWEGGQFCQVQCKNGTQMASASLKKLYVCQGQKKEWSSKPPEEKTCATLRGHKSSHYIGLEVFYYFDGDCTDPGTQQQIAKNFIERMKNSLYQPEACPDSNECNKGNVQISCGESSRKKRESDSNSILILTVKLSVTLHDNESLNTAEDRFNKLLHGAKEVFTYNITNLFGNATVSLREFVTKGLQIECPEGSVKSEQSFDCTDCVEGTFYTSKSNPPSCQVCRKGTFQNKAAQSSCLLCPIGTTTHGAGASSVNECEEACGPGTYSSDGLLPCSPCEQGYYQASYGQTFCQPCLGAKFTLTFGASSASDCEEFDIQLITEDQSNIQVTLPNYVTLQDFTLAFWYQNTATNNNYPTIAFSNNEKEAHWIWEGLRDVKQINSMESKVNFGLPDKRWHHITLYKSPNCTISVTVDGMALSVTDAIRSCPDVVFNSISITSDNQTSGCISQLNMWHGELLSGYSDRCFSNDIGNVFSWKAVGDAYSAGAYMNIPSTCDDYDNCVSSPCLHGSCTDVLHGFSCTCDKGYLGKQCEINIDDCEANVCLNNASCIDGVNKYSCLCMSYFTGQYCEIKMVNGEWSEWGNWSECSTTCGDGERKRKRLCNSPSPDNGGKDCHGDAFDFMNCNNSDCPVCPKLSPPVNGSLDCVNDTDTINCTISCDDGYDFDIEPLPLYYCGPHTFQEWSYQTEENPERRLPRCVEIKVPKEMTVIYTAHYKDLYCSHEDLEDFATEQIDLRVNAVLSNVECLVKNTCSLNYINIIDCNSKSETRRRRSMGTTAGFSLQLKTNPTEDNKNETMQDLEDAFQTIQTAADSGDLTVQVLDDDYTLISNSTEIYGDVMCRPGQTKVKFYCVPCGKGSYLNTEICKPCPVGTYQEHEGQASCINCPKGKSTIGIQSININECTVDVLVPIEEGLKVTGIIVGCVCALVVIAVSTLIYRRYKSSRTKHVEVTDINNVTRQENSHVGQKNTHFELYSLTCQPSSTQMQQVDADDDRVTPKT